MWQNDPQQINEYLTKIHKNSNILRSLKSFYVIEIRALVITKATVLIMLYENDVVSVVNSLRVHYFNCMLL
jgi:hypothetical protein